MITTLEIIDFIYNVLASSALSAEITGIVNKQNRPQNSKKEDCVINMLGISNQQLQEGVANVNIYVPNLIITSSGTQDSSQPDWRRLKQLALIAVDLLNDCWTDDFHFTIQNQSIIKDDESDSHFVNLRLEVYANNL